MYHQQQRVYHEMAIDTKIFVGGLAWETKRDAMRLYFQQFGEIIEAVVISDKNTGRSKGYGFVTFKDADAAMRACENPNPVIDGRRANCNLASLGARNNTAPQHHYAGIVPYRPRPEFVTPPPSAYYSSSSPYYPQGPQYTFPYPSASYGYNNNNNVGYTQDATMYPMNYLGNPPMYGGQPAAYYYNNGGGVYSNMYEHAQQPHHHHSNTSNYGVFHNYPQMFHYPPPYFQSLPSSSSSLPTATITTIASPDSTTETQNTAGVAANKESNQ